MRGPPVFGVVWAAGPQATMTHIHLSPASPTGCEYAVPLVPPAVLPASWDRHRAVPGPGQGRPHATHLLMRADRSVIFGSWCWPAYQTSGQSAQTTKQAAQTQPFPVQPAPEPSCSPPHVEGLTAAAGSCRLVRIRVQRPLMQVMRFKQEAAGRVKVAEDQHHQR